MKQFDTWEAAFDACREADAPIVVSVPCDDGNGREVNRIYPSGTGKFIRFEDRTSRETRDYRNSPCDHLAD